jgi:SAM-dependent methyltransferase
MTSPVSSCEVCGARALAPVLDLGAHPMCDDLVAVGDARICREYPIEILYCADCATAHQRFQVPKQELFPRSYHYRSRFTADVLDGMKELVASCEARFGGLAGRTVLDVGCNDGSLLDFFRERGAKTVGIEPTDAAKDAQAKGHAVYNGFLEESLAGEVAAKCGKPDFITFTNVFAHIENLPGVVASLKRLIGASTRIVIENHYLGAVLDGNQFDTFYHEHPRTYSATSFERIARALGLPLAGVEFPSRYGGNIRVYLGGDSGSMDAALLERERAYGERFAELAANVGRWKAKKGAQIAALVREHGPLRAKAFPGRAAILVKLLGLGTESIVAVHEKPGSMKIGHYLPGTRIPIVSDELLFSGKAAPVPVLNLAWHISTEIHGYLRRNGYAGPVVDILTPRDFSG